MRRVYVAHPFSGDTARNVESVRGICRRLAREGIAPVAPHLYLPAFVDEASERDLALRICEALVAACDEVRVYGEQVTPGMDRELRLARALDIPVVRDDAAPATPPRALAFLDVETTGLDPEVHALVEVAAIRVDARTLAVLDRIEARVIPPTDAPVTAEAARLNGYSPEAWADASPPAEVLPRLARVLGGSTLAGHNVAFDWAFVRAACRRAGLPPPAVDYHMVDTVSLAWPLFQRGEVASLSLRDLCPRFGVPNDGAHRAAADVERCLRVYAGLMEVWRSALSRAARLGGQA
ncbi:MAG: hypothetical protein HYZ28_21365 [Myxococcales bacterium]|nr:hypothetical protein [Myxococcales bacterium]